MMQSARHYIIKQDITSLDVGRDMNGGLEHDRPILRVCSCLDSCFPSFASVSMQHLGSDLLEWGHGPYWRHRRYQ